MKSWPISRAPVLAFALGLGLLAACDEDSHPLSVDSPEGLQVTEAPRKSQVKDPLTIMSRNLYHGGDIAPVLEAGFSDLAVLAGVAGGVWDEVQGNDFHERVGKLVDEIEVAMPDIVGIQELAEFMVFGLNMSTGEFEFAGEIDFQDIMEGELAARGLPYSFLAVQNNTVVKVPVAGIQTPDRFIPTQLVQLSIRDGVLVRNDFQVDNVTMGNYQAVVPLGLDPFGNPIELKRGWIRVDAHVEGVPYHFVNTHMEIQAFAPFQLLHTEELLTEVAADLEGVTVLLGDFNSDAAAEMGDESWTATYQEIIAAGYSDTWAMVNPGKSSQGFTCCHDSDLRNPLSALHERIDFVFVKTSGLKGPKGHFPGSISVDVIGDDPALKTMPNGLWPSDHGGLVADLWWAPGQLKKLK